MKSTKILASVLAFSLVVGSSAWAELTGLDIGVTYPPNPPGTLTINILGSDYTIIAAGADIWGNADSFYYAYEADPALKVSGDFEAKVQVESLAWLHDPNNVHNWAKAGIMARADLTEGSAHAMSIRSGHNGVQLQVRQVAGGHSISKNLGSGDVFGRTIWLKLARQGNVFAAWWSEDVGGVPDIWQNPTIMWVGMPADIYLGLATTSHNNIPADNVVRAVYKNYSVGPLTDFPPVPDLFVPVDSPAGGAGYMGIREVIDNGNIRDQDACYNSLNSGTGTIVDYNDALILNIQDSGPNGYYGYDNDFGVVFASYRTKGSVDDLSMAAKGTIRIPTSGDYTFCVNSDDGFTLQFPGHDFSSISGGGEIAAFSNGHALRFWGGRDVADTLGIINLPAGDHPFVLTYHEGVVGAAVELSATPVPDLPLDFLLVGDPEGLELVFGPTVEFLHVLTPIGGETLPVGSGYLITWQSQGAISDVVIEYSTNNGGTWTQVDPPNTGNTGSYNWLVPGVTSNQCLVRVSDAAHPAVFDTSDAVFRIRGPAFVDEDATGGANNGSSWADAYNHLQDALRVAVSRQEIWVAEGTYKPDANTANPGGTDDRIETFQLINGVGIYGGYAGVSEPYPNARDVDLYETILSGEIGGAGNSDNSYHVVTGSGTDANAVLDGFTITAGNANGSNPHNRGGGMYNDEGSPKLVNCNITNNTAGSNGGGMYIGSGNPTLVNCIFSGNGASMGGGLSTSASSSVTVVNCVFTANSGGNSGGGILSNGSLIVTNSVFYMNQVTPGSGGAISNWTDSTLTVQNSILWSNLPDQIFVLAGSSAPVVTYNDVQGGWSGPGANNINLNPMFKDADGPDDILGTEDDNLELAADSGCIDAGDNNSVPADMADLDGDGDTSERTPLDLGGNARFTDDPTVGDTGVAAPGYPEIVEMGAYERYEFCGSEAYPYPPGDLAGPDGVRDCRVDFFDFAFLVAHWLEDTGPE